MRGVELFMGCFVIACAMSEFEAPAALAQQRNWVPARLPVFLLRSILPPDAKQTVSDEHYTGCRGLPGTCHGRCEGTNFAGPWSQVMGSATAVVPPVLLESLG